jgi:hypothetical protein
LARVSTEAKKRYSTKLQEFKADIEKIEQREKKVLALIKSKPEQTNVRKLSLAHDSLNLVSYYLLMNELSVTLLGVKNDSYLNAARKGCYKSIIYLEEVLSAFIDAPFSDYEEQLESVKRIDEEKRYFLIRKLGFAIESLIDAFGDNTKWKWSFVELEGRFTTVTKNMLDLKNLLAGLDPRADGYETRLSHLNLAKRLMQKSADGYRQKYELSTSRIDDFKLAIAYLSGLRRLHIVLGEAEDSEALKKKIEIWRTKMEADSKRLEQADKAKSRQNTAKKKA